MKTVTKVLAGVIAALTALAQVPAVQAAVAAFVTSHPSVATLVAGLSAVLALLHVPTDPAKQ